MLMVTKVVAAGVTALAFGGTPSPNSGPADLSRSAEPVVAAQAYPASQCTSGCNVWRLMYDGR